MDIDTFYDTTYTERRILLFICLFFYLRYLSRYTKGLLLDLASVFFNKCMKWNDNNMLYQPFTNIEITHMFMVTMAMHSRRCTLATQITPPFWRRTIGNVFLDTFRNFVRMFTPYADLFERLF